MEEIILLRFLSIEVQEFVTNRKRNMMGEKAYILYVVLWGDLFKSVLLEPKIYSGIEIQKHFKCFEKRIELDLDLAP
jgi:hypothetical protein